MSHGFKLAFLALSLSLGASGAMATDDPAMICDISAGSPQDLDLPEGVTGIAFDALNPTDDVEAACLAASELDPAERRFFTHLGRIYAKRGETFKAVDAYRKAHGRGSAVAANNLGAMYIAGDGVKVSEVQATRLIRQAAHRGLPFAMGTMAVRAREGLGMAASQALSLYWYERAHEAGDAIATNDLGVIYQNGFGVREDDERALALFSKALERDPNAGIAAYNIARAYERGEGVETDLNWARGYYVLAFEGGFIDAASDLGRLHFEGLGTVVDQNLAIDWIRRGVEGGSLMATVDLADAYLTGAGVEQDAEEARSLYNAVLDLDPDESWSAYIDQRLNAVSELEVLGTSDNN